MKLTTSAYVLRITEHERGWGSRPEGYYVFGSKDDATAFLIRETAGRTGVAPDVYESYDHVGYHPIGPEFQRMLEITKATKVHVRRLDELAR